MAPLSAPNPEGRMFHTSSNQTSGERRVLLVEKHQCDLVFAVALLLFRQVKM